MNLNSIKIFNAGYQTCEDVKFDVIFTDVPYNIGRDAYASNPRWWKDGKFENGKSEKANSMFFETDEHFDLFEWLSWCSEHLKEDGKLITFCSVEQMAELIQNHKGFKKYTPLIFIKNNSAEVLKTNLRIVGACEYGIILYKNKLGKFNNNGKQIKNWFEYKKPYKPAHPNQKPYDLCYKILELYTNENDLICDTCMGSGVIIKVAKDLNLNAYGFEIDEKYFELAKNNIYGDEHEKD